MAPMLKTCPACSGRGVVPRARRYIDGVPDAFDTRTEETCAPCGGSGKVRDAGPRGGAPIAAIDPNDCCF